MTYVNQLVYLIQSVAYALMVCLPSEVYVPGQNGCKKSCPIEKYIFEQHCVDSCPLFSTTLETSLAKYCILKNEFTCHRLTCDNEYPFCYGINCLDACPEYTVVYNYTCVTHCPSDSPFLTAYNSEGLCLTGLKVCLPKCPTSHPFVFNSTNFVHCLKDCPNYFVKSVESMSCYSNCPSSSPFLLNSTCHESCPDQYNYVFVIRSFDSEVSICTDSCPEDTVLDDMSCVRSCPSGKHLFNNTCVKKCPKTHPNHFPLKLPFERSDIPNFGRADIMCVNTCVENYTNINRFSNYPLLYGTLCVERCPNESKLAFEGVCVSICPKDNDLIESNWGRLSCVQSCRHYIYNKTCVSSCPKSATYEFNGSCIASCPTDHRFYSSVGFSEMGPFGWLETLSCRNSCASYDFNGKCVYKCPNEAKFKHGNSCVTDCYGNLPLKYTNATHYNTGSEFFFPHTTDYICVNNCPLGTLNYNNTACVPYCPQLKHLEFNGSCYEDCPLSNKFKLYIGKHIKCVTECSTLVYNNTCVTSCPKDTFIFNSSCVYECPTTHLMNYTKNSKGYGIYECVHNCPNGTYFYNNSCFDKCPGFLKSHLFVCTKVCPSSHPFTDFESRKCIKFCSNKSVIVDTNFCDAVCPKHAPFIENSTCVKNCHSRKSVYEETSRGKICHDTCPNHLFLLKDKGTCVAKCPEQNLIVKSICLHIEQCPSHTFIEISDIGKRCTNRCSKEFYLDGIFCVKECPSHKVIADRVCEEKCPESLPLTYKSYLSKTQIVCYNTCPSGYLANGTVCIEDYECTSSKHFSYNGVCYPTCPYLTLESGYYKCQSMWIYIAIAIVSLICIIVSVVLLYFTVYFTGVSKQKSCAVSYSNQDTHRERDSLMAEDHSVEASNNELMANSSQIYTKKRNESLDTQLDEHIAMEIIVDNK